MPISGAPLDHPVDLSKLLTTGLRYKPDAPAVVLSDGALSWRELDLTSSRLAANLLGLGLAPGDRIASLMPNRIALVVHYIACVKAGLVATPLNYRYMPPEIDHALEVSGAKALLAHGERDGDIAASKLAGGLPLGVISYGAEDSAGPSYETLAAEAPPSRDLAPLDPAAPAFIFFTSGSTGPAKGVTHSAETLGWIAASTIAGMEIGAEDSLVTGSSLSHEGGVGFSFATLAAGARLVVARNFDGAEVLPLFRTYRPTLLWTLPAALNGLLRDHGATREDFSSFRLFCTGGDKAPIELERAFAHLTGFEIHESYGMTEIGCANLNPPSGVNKPGSIGPLAPGYLGQIRDDQGRDLPAGQEGRLWIKFPGTMIGYWNNPEATAATLVDGWLDTGDVMKADDDGYLRFAGRKKQIIVHDGSNICPQEVEGALLAHGAVASAAAIGVHDLRHGETVRAYVALKPEEKAPSGAELIAFARTRIGYKAPEEIVFLDEIPLTPVGKLDRTSLKRQAEAQLAATAGS